MVLTHLSVLAPLGIPPVLDVTAGWREADAQRAAAALAPLNHQPYVVLHLYPKFNYKMWHDGGWIALAHWISDRGFRVVLTGGNAAAEMNYVQRLATHVPDGLNLAGQLTLNECAWVLANATAYVGPDTALTHMAAALGVPTVALFGPTDPVRWGPWPKGHVALENPWRRLGHQSCRRVRLLQGSAACAPCGHEGCDRHVDSFSDCLLNLPAAQVINTLSEVANIV
jgi:heptosyltransferase-3